MSRASRASKGGCPLCGQPASQEHRPFCSRGCRDRDLINWLGDAYRVPGAAADPGEVAEGGLDSENRPPL